MGITRDLWLRWKMLRLPWRRKFFVGQDLQANTFWEFRDPLNKNRLRRIVEKSHLLPRGAYGDIEITPQWHQWLRQTRLEAPSLDEQKTDILRQTQLKINSRIADEEWNNKAKYIEEPKTQPAMLKGDVRLDAARAEKDPNAKSTFTSAVGDQGQVQNPWAKQAAAKGVEYQPDAWSPGPGKKGR